MVTLLGKSKWTVVECNAWLIVCILGDICGLYGTQKDINLDIFLYQRGRCTTKQQLWSLKKQKRGGWLASWHALSLGHLLNGSKNVYPKFCGGQGRSHLYIYILVSIRYH